jgi:hypothetical protein
MQYPSTFASSGPILIPPCNQRRPYFSNISTHADRTQSSGLPQVPQKPSRYMLWEPLRLVSKFRITRQMEPFGTMPASPQARTTLVQCQAFDSGRRQTIVQPLWRIRHREDADGVLWHDFRTLSADLGPIWIQFLVTEGSRRTMVVSEQPLILSLCEREDVLWNELLTV